MELTWVRVIQAAIVLATAVWVQIMMRRIRRSAIRDNQPVDVAADRFAWGLLILATADATTWIIVSGLWWPAFTTRAILIVYTVGFLVWRIRQTRALLAATADLKRAEHTAADQAVERSEENR